MLTLDAARGSHNVLIDRDLQTSAVANKEAHTLGKRQGARNERGDHRASLDVWQRYQLFTIILRHDLGFPHYPSKQDGRKVESETRCLPDAASPQPCDTGEM